LPGRRKSAEGFPAKARGAKDALRLRGAASRGGMQERSSRHSAQNDTIGKLEAGRISTFARKIPRTAEKRRALGYRLVMTAAVEG
jgi:hypothetical protein